MSLGQVSIGRVGWRAAGQPGCSRHSLPSRTVQLAAHRGKGLLTIAGAPARLIPGTACLAPRPHPAALARLFPPASPPLTHTHRLPASQLMAFSGPAPELINGRLSMLAFVAALGAELASGEPVLRQLGEEPTGECSGHTWVLCFAMRRPGGASWASSPPASFCVDGLEGQTKSVQAVWLVLWPAVRASYPLPPRYLAPLHASAHPRLALFSPTIPPLPPLPAGVFLAIITFAAASLIPMLQSAERKPFGPFTPAAEMLVSPAPSCWVVACHACVCAGARPCQARVAEMLVG